MDVVEGYIRLWNESEVWYKMFASISNLGKSYNKKEDGGQPK